MVLGEYVLTGHGYDSPRRGVEEGCEVDGGEVDEWVVVRVRRERPEDCGPAVKASKGGLRLPSPPKQSWRCRSLQPLTHNLWGTIIFGEDKRLCKIVVLEAN
jgi:hypothetical protein